MDRIRFYLYHAALFLMGLIWGGRSLLTIRAEELSLPLALFAVGGLGMTLAVGYGLSTTDPETFAMSRGAVIAVVVAALLTLVGVTV
jgi:hypothetical protein